MVMGRQALVAVDVADLDGLGPERAGLATRLVATASAPHVRILFADIAFSRVDATAERPCAAGSSAII